MKHKQYEQWILGEEILDPNMQQNLNHHLKTCKSCRTLKENWTASEQLLKAVTIKTPTQGFADRWKSTLAREKSVEKIRSHRITVLLLILLAFVSSFVYMLVSGSFVRVFADGFNAITQLLIGITHGLSSMGFWVSKFPVALSLTFGFIFFGLINAFVVSVIFFIWNIQQRKLDSDEIFLD